MDVSVNVIPGTRLHPSEQGNFLSAGHRIWLEIQEGHERKEVTEDFSVVVVIY